METTMETTTDDSSFVVTPPAQADDHPEEGRELGDEPTTPNDAAAENSDTTSTLIDESSTERVDSSNPSSQEEQEATTNEQPKPSVKRATSDEVIDLFDDEDAGVSNENDAKRARHEDSPVSAAAISSYQHRVLPNWMQQPRTGPPLVQPASLKYPPPSSAMASTMASVPQAAFIQNRVMNVPHYVAFPPGFQPTWSNLLPPFTRPQPPTAHTAVGPRVYQLSLLNVKEFTIEGLSATFEGPPTPVTGLRKPLRQICRNLANGAKPEYYEGRWRIPLAAYHAVASYLQNLPSRVAGVPANQLQIASLECQRQTKGYPEPESLVQAGVPVGLANALAPFQRGGVDFVRTKGGRALIADDMGLGKSIQSVASMALYKNDWPVLVLSPSGARYHWEHEFRHWLGASSEINKKANKDSMFVDADRSDTEGLLQDWQIHVLTSSKAKVLPQKGTKIVICSYGLVVSLIQAKRLRPGMFKCAVVDESHMLKNKASKRTIALLPILQQTKRCLLLSGTPALARPSELWPQLSILNSVGAHGWDISEDDFVKRYVKAGNRRAELHTMLTGTVMIRRLKVDILKSLPNKLRQKAHVSVVEPSMVPKFRELMLELKEGKGLLGSLAKIHAAETRDDGLPDAPDVPRLTNSKEALDMEIQQKMEAGRIRIEHSVQQRAHELDGTQRHQLQMELEGNLRADLEREYRERMSQTPIGHSEDNGKKNVLTQLYSLTGEVKIPLVVDMLKRWLKDPTKGKVCIFAHHISVLDAIERECKLSSTSKTRKFIRIDGSTAPKVRQEQINTYQTDPSVRVALLGITAAGVAVTLTASSTVWFTELFWTPALMIQAEDRCHRIGQSARVNCLYIVAKGTLDDILWRLIDKKFRDLGEFVEGKEKLKLVVEQTFASTKDLYADMFAVEENVDDEDELKMDDIQDLQFDLDLVEDIEALAESERRMLQQSMDPDDPDPLLEYDSKPAAATEHAPTTGHTEDNAIALLDDDPVATPSASATTSAASSSAAPARPQPSETGSQRSQPDVALSGCQLYKIIIGERTLGLELSFQSGRIFVSGIKKERLLALGGGCKPDVGDILVAINGAPLGMLSDMSSTIHTLRYYLKTPPIELMFMECPHFARALRSFASRRGAAPMEAPSSQAAAAKKPPDGGDDVIELLDDD